MKPRCAEHFRKNLPHRLRRGWIILSLLPVLLQSAMAQTRDSNPVEEEERYKPAREIDFLRKHFLILYFEMKSPGVPLGRNPAIPVSSRDDLFIQRFIDKRIDHYVEDIREKMDRIEASLAAAEGTTSAEGISALRSDSELRRELAGEIKSMSRDVGNLHRSLSSVLFDIKRKTKYTPDLKNDDESLSGGVQYVKDQIGGAFGRISDLFFEPRNVVRVGQLQNDNLLIQLHRAQKMLKAMGKSLER